MNPSHSSRARLSLALVGVSVALLALGGCSTDSTSQAFAAEIGFDTVPISPVVAGTALAVTAVAADAPSAAPTTVAPPATDPAVPAPVETVPVETAPVETVPVETAPVETAPVDPATTMPPLAINEQWVGPFPSPIPAVGKRSGNDTKIVQLRLLQLGFWVSAADGEYGLTTRQAVMAFQKYIGIPATGEVSADTATWMTNLAIKAHGQTDTGNIIEVDKGRQLLFFAIEGQPLWVFNTSTATGLPYEEEDKNTPGEIQKGVSITPDGLWKVNRERPEGWWEGDLGKIYRPKYFRGGVAVHGSNSIPNYPASHGCVRLSVPAMDFVWDNNLMPMGVTVWVHE